MGVGWYVTLQRELPGVDPSAVDGKALIHAQHQLRVIAERLGLTPLLAFLATNPAELGWFLQREGLDPEDYPLPEEEWFDPANGLATVRGLLADLRRDPRGINWAEQVVRDLEALAVILDAAAREQVPFHLSTGLPA